MINGIKPAMKTTTKLRIKPTSFDEAMDVFCNNAVRGNIYDTSSFQKTDMHGGWLYAK
jgi:hypothetical protein